MCVSEREKDKERTEERGHVRERLNEGSGQS